MLDKKEFCRAFVNAVNTDPLFQLAMRHSNDLTLSEAIDLTREPSLCLVPDPYKVQFINHIQSIKNNLYPSNKVTLYQPRKKKR